MFKLTNVFENGPGLQLSNVWKAAATLTLFTSVIQWIFLCRFLIYFFSSKCFHFNQKIQWETSQWVDLSQTTFFQFQKQPLEDLSELKAFPSAGSAEADKCQLGRLKVFPDMFEKLVCTTYHFHTSTPVCSNIIEHCQKHSDSLTGPPQTGFGESLMHFQHFKVSNCCNQT